MKNIELGWSKMNEWEVKWHCDYRHTMTCYTHFGYGCDGCPLKHENIKASINIFDQIIKDLKSFINKVFNRGDNAL